MPPKELTIRVGEDHTVSGLLQVPRQATGCFVMAHGAGAGMTHPFLEAVATGLFDRKIASLRFQFPYMEKGSKRPDTPAIAQAAVRAAVAEAERRLPDLPLFAGGKSFGGRMTSQAQAADPLPGVRGLAFLSFPLHAAQKPSDTRAAHLSRIEVPMLFLQGTRDALADLTLLRAVVQSLGAKATLVEVEGGDHSFQVLVRSGRTDADAMGQLVDAAASWFDSISGGAA